MRRLSKTNIVVVSIIGLFVMLVLGYTAFGDSLINITLRTVEPLQNGLVGHWTLDGKDVVTSTPVVDAEDLAPEEIDANASSYVGVDNVDDDSIVMAYNLDVGLGRFKLMNIDGTVEDGPTTFNAGSSEYIDVAMMDNELAAFAYRDADTNGKFTIENVLTGSTEVAEIAFEGSFAIVDISVAKVDSSLFAIAYTQDLGSFYRAAFQVWDKGGREETSTVTVGSTVSSSTAVARVDDDSIAITFTENATTDVRLVVYNVDGTEELASTVIESDMANHTAIIGLDEDSVAIAFDDPGDSNKGKFVVYNIDGTEELAATEFESGVVTWISMDKVDSDSVAISYGDGSTNGQYVIYNIDGTQELAPTEFESGHTDHTDISIVDESTLVIGYTDEGDTSKPKMTTRGFNFTRTVADVSSSGNDGTNTDGVEEVAGRIGQGLEFDGSSNYIDVGTGPSTVNTIAFWMRADDNTFRPIIDIDGTDEIELSGGAGNVVTATSFPAASVYVDGVSAADVDTGWHHVVVTDSTGVNASNMEIGRADSDYFDGALDDIRMYNRVLSVTEIDRLYHQGRTSKINVTPHIFVDDLTTHLTLDANDIVWGDTSSEIKDISVNGNHADASSLTENDVYPGRLGQGLRYDSTSDQLFMDAGSATNRTISFWINPDSVSSGTVLQFAIADIVELFAGEVVLTSFPGTTNIYVDNVDTDTITTGWHHVVITDTSGVDCTSNCKVGVSPNSFTGFIDDIRFFDRVLDTAEISRLYHLGRTSKVNVSLPLSTDIKDNLLGHWTFDGPDMDWSSSTAEVLDISGNNYHLNFVATGGHQNQVRPGKIGQAWKVNSSTQTRVNPEDPLSFPGVNDTKSIAFWMNPADITSRKILDIDGTDQLEIDAKGKVTATSFPGTVTIYMNGVVGSSTIANKWQHVVVTDTTGVNAIDFEYGRADGSYFSGLLDELQFYDKVLTADEVSRLYELGQ